jgi:Uncharacterized conserved protein
MDEKVTEIKGLEIYTPKGVFVGVVDEVVFDVSEMKVDAIFVADANPYLVDENVSISIPFRWIQSIGDIVILNRFPDEVIKADSV